MATQTFTAIVRRENGGYQANSPEAGISSYGATIDEALINLKETTERYLNNPALLESNGSLLTTFEVEIPEQPSKRQFFTAKELLESGLVGLWSDRTDIGDSVEFAQGLRERAQRREHE